MEAQRNPRSPALVFLIAGQSNAGGSGVVSPESYGAYGNLERRPLISGTTAKEIGLPTDPDAYSHSYIWVPERGFEAIVPDTNCRPGLQDGAGHGIELPVLCELERRFAQHDIFVIKYGPGNTNLPVYIRKHIFDWPNIDAIISSQEDVVRTTPNCYLLDIDLGDRTRNYDAWAFSPNNGHISSKGFVELTKRLFAGPLKEAGLEHFDAWSPQQPVWSAIAGGVSSHASSVRQNP